MRTDTGEGAPTSMRARACRPTRLRRRSPLARTAVLPAVVMVAVAACTSLYAQNTAFVARLRRLGIPVRFDDYGPGSHDWPYWQRELHRSLPLLLAALQQH